MGRSGAGGKEVVTLLEMLTVGAALLWRTRLHAPREVSSCQRSTTSTLKVVSMSLQSISWPVAASHTIRRMQGGGVMGRRSCHWPHVSVLCPDRSNGMLRELSYLVAKTTHSGSDGLLVDAQPANCKLTWKRRSEERYGPVGLAAVLANVVAGLVTGGHVAVHDLRLHLLRRRRRGLLLLLSRRRKMHHLLGWVVKLRGWRQRTCTWALLLLWWWCWDGILVALARMGVHDG